jgi:uncharacterized iron-regulated protein
MIAVDQTICNDNPMQKRVHRTENVTAFLRAIAPLRITSWSRYSPALIALTLFLSACIGGAARKLNIEDSAGIGQMLMDLEKTKVVFVGEFHDQREHHRLQLQIIKYLHGKGIPLAIGFEMFTPGQQPLLDRWVQGKVPLEDFVAGYLQRWKISWAEYDQIMLFARNNAIPMVALDAPAELVQAITRAGAGAFSPDLLQRMSPGVTTDISDSYRNFLFMAFGSHNMPDFMFDNFCAAQGFRNSFMARRIMDYMNDNPGRKMIVIAGVGHAMRRAVPAFMSDNLIAHRIVIPKKEGLYDELDRDDMDYFVEMATE